MSYLQGFHCCCFALAVLPFPTFISKLIFLNGILGVLSVPLSLLWFRSPGESASPCCAISWMFSSFFCPVGYLFILLSIQTWCLSSLGFDETAKMRHHRTSFCECERQPWSCKTSTLIPSCLYYCRPSEVY